MPPFVLRMSMHKYPYAFEYADKFKVSVSVFGLPYNVIGCIQVSDIYAIILYYFKCVYGIKF